MEINGQKSDPNASTLQEISDINSGNTTVESDTPEESEQQTSPEANSAATNENLEQSLDAQTQSDADTPPEPSVTQQTQAIEYDGKQFATEAEMYDYMKSKLSEGETERAIMQARQEAYEQAMQNLSPQQQAQAPEAPAEPQDDFNEEEYYQDPVGYMKRREAKLAEKLRADITKEQEARHADERLWTEFFQDYPDLDGFKQDCELVLNQNLDTVKLLARKSKKEAMKFLATKTREKFQTWAERQKPQQTLPNTKAGPSSGSSFSGVTPPTQNEPTKDLDFVSEFNSMFD